MTRAIVTFGYVGLLPWPAIAAALAALPCGWLLHWAGGFPLLAAATAALYAAGTWATGREIRRRVDKDPPEIVIDEVAGMWVALFPLSAGLWLIGAPPQLFPWPGWLGALVLFLAFDTWKPWPVSWADTRPGPAGVMLGDVVAGAMAAVLVAIAGALAHGALM